MFCFSGEEPADVSPKAAVVGRVRVAFFVGVLMMHAMSGNPEDGSAFECECAADGEEVLEPSGSFVAAMREEAVVAHADAEASGDPPEKHGDEERLPMKHEERSDSTGMERNHDEEGDPDDGLGKGSVAA